MSIEAAPGPYAGTAELRLAADGTVTDMRLDTPAAIAPPAVTEPSPELTISPDDIYTRLAGMRPIQADVYVAQTDSHRGQLRREAVARRASLRNQIGIAALTLAGAATFLYNAAKVDQDVLAPVVWGNNPTTTYQVAANQYHYDEPPTGAMQHDPSTLVLVAGGMGINDSGPRIARPLIPALSDGIPNSKLYAMTYGARINLPDIYRAVDAMLAESPANRIILYGMSTGCKTTQYAAVYLRKTYPDRFLMANFCDSGPVDAHSTYELRRDPSKITLGAWAANARLQGAPALATIIDITSGNTRAKYHLPDGRFDSENFWNEVRRIVKDKWNSSAASNELRIGQLALIVDDSAADTMETIGQTPDGMPPMTFVYLAPTRDYTVDGAYASRRFGDFANQNGITNKIVHLESEHAGDAQYADTYNWVIAETLRQINAETALWYDKHRPVAPTLAAESIATKTTRPVR